jgi:hypothetical protein
MRIHFAGALLAASFLCAGCDNDHVTAGSSLFFTGPSPTIAGANVRLISLGDTFTGTLTATDPFCGFGVFTPAQRFRLGIPRTGTLFLRLTWDSFSNRLFFVNVPVPRCCVSPLITTFPVTFGQTLDFCVAAHPNPLFPFSGFQPFLLSTGLQ